MLKYLRIAISAACGIVCLVLIVLWARSYSHFEWLRMKQPARSVVSLHGRLRFNDVYNLNSAVTGRVIAPRFETDNISFWSVEHDTLLAAGVGRSVPHWALVVATALLSGLPWAPARFSLRTLLIATTLVAVVLGLAVAFR